MQASSSRCLQHCRTPGFRGCADRYPDGVIVPPGLMRLPQSPAYRLDRQCDRISVAPGIGDPAIAFERAMSVGDLRSAPDLSIRERPQIPCPLDGFDLECRGSLSPDVRPAAAGKRRCCPVSRDNADPVPGRSRSVRDVGCRFAPAREAVEYRRDHGGHRVAAFQPRASITALENVMVPVSRRGASRRAASTKAGSCWRASVWRR